MRCAFIHEECETKGCGDWCPMYPPTDVDEALARYVDEVGKPPFSLTEKQRTAAVHVHAALAASEPAKGNGHSVMDSFVAYHYERRDR